MVNQNGSVTNREVQKLLKVSNKKAYQLLQELVNLTILHQVGLGRSVRYLNHKPKNSKLKLSTFQGIKGYFISDIKKAMSPAKYKRLSAWISGQTVMKKGNDTFVYQHDLERFLKGLDPVD